MKFISFELCFFLFKDGCFGLLFWFIFDSLGVLVGEGVFDFDIFFIFMVFFLFKFRGFFGLVFGIVGVDLVKLGGNGWVMLLGSLSLFDKVFDIGFFIGLFIGFFIGFFDIDFFMFFMFRFMLFIGEVLVLVWVIFMCCFCNVCVFVMMFMGRLLVFGGGFLVLLRMLVIFEVGFMCVLF